MARHDVVVFSHDDVELVSPRPFDAIAHALQRHDVVGLAGSRLVSGPAVMWAGHPHLHGHVAYPDGGRDFQATVFSLECGLLDGMQALDGMLIAARRAAALRIGFDERTFDGFHFYDLDFTYRAHLAGLSVAVTTDVTAIHASNGEFGDEWRRGAHRFVAKFPGMNAPVGSHHAYAARLESRPKVARFYEELRGLAATP
jgi:GT2 family glycosyltransferase